MKAVVYSCLLAGVLLSAPLVAVGQDFSSQIVEVDAPARSKTDQLAELVVLTGELAQEVRQLRGQVEEQAYELRKLQQQRLDDYRSLDKRLAELATGAAQLVEPPGTAADGSAVAAADQSEKETYRQAFALVKQQNFEAAVTALQGLLQRFPDGAYAGDAYYWLGELYDQDGNLSSAQMSLEALIAQFPDHRRVPDAHYKLARVFQKQGNDSAAKRHADIVLKQYSAKASTLKLTQEFLARYYP